jgi:hypothetical protein
MTSSGDFISQYLEYTDKTECPVIYSRWSAIVGIGALLGRSTWINHGHFNIYPNIYAMLVGTAGARKSTSIKLIQSLLKNAGYNKFSPNKVKPETFLKILSEEAMPAAESVEDFLWQDVGTSDSSELFITADEFNNFIGVGNLEFMSILGELWDFHGEYKNPLATKKSVYINNPTVSMLAGNTPTNIHTCFPAEALGQGFFSRIIFVYSEPRAVKIPFPEKPAEERTKYFTSKLLELRDRKYGPIKIQKDAVKMLEKIYMRGASIEDTRFDSYNTRRFTHLLKLCIIVFVADMAGATQVEPRHVQYANTILTHAEKFMPKALGEFGRARNSDVGHKVVQLLASSDTPLILKDIWKHVSQDLEKPSALTEILQSLVMADKIQLVPGMGFLARRTVIEEIKDDTVDFELLTKEEREMSV